MLERPLQNFFISSFDMRIMHLIQVYHVCIMCIATTPTST